MQGAVQMFPVTGTVILRNNNRSTGSQSNEKSHYKIDDLRCGTAHGCKRSFPNESAYDNGVGCVIKLLEESSKYNRKEKKQQLFPDDTFYNLILGCFFCVHRYNPSESKVISCLSVLRIPSSFIFFSSRIMALRSTER